MRKLLLVLMLFAAFSLHIDQVEVANYQAYVVVSKSGCTSDVTVKVYCDSGTKSQTSTSFFEFDLSDCKKITLIEASCPSETREEFYVCSTPCIISELYGTRQMSVSTFQGVCNVDCDRFCKNKGYDYGYERLSECRYNTITNSYTQDVYCVCVKSTTLKHTISKEIILDKSLCYSNNLAWIKDPYSINFWDGSTLVTLGPSICLYYGGEVPGRDFSVGGSQTTKVSYKKTIEVSVNLEIQNNYLKKPYGTGWWDGDAISGFDCIFLEEQCVPKEKPPGMIYETAEKIKVTCNDLQNTCEIYDENGDYIKSVDYVSYSADNCNLFCKQVGYDAGSEISHTSYTKYFEGTQVTCNIYECECKYYVRDFGCCYPDECWNGKYCVSTGTITTVNDIDYVCWYGKWYEKTACYDKTGILCTQGEKYIVRDECKNELGPEDVGELCWKEEETCISGVVTYDNWSGIFGKRPYECTPNCLFNGSPEYPEGSIIEIKYNPNGEVQYYEGEEIYHSYICYDHLWRDPDDSEEYCKLFKEWSGKEDVGWTGSYCCGDDSNETWVCINNRCKCVSSKTCDPTVLPFWYDQNYYIYPKKNSYSPGEFFYLCKKEKNNPIYCEWIRIFVCEGAENCPNKSGFCIYNASLEDISINGHNPCDPTWEEGFRIPGVNAVYEDSIVINGTANVGSVVSGDLYYLSISGDYFNRSVYIEGDFFYTQLNIINNACIGDDPGERFIVRYCQGKYGYTCTTDFSDIINVSKSEYDAGYCVYNGGKYESGSLIYDWIYYKKIEKDNVEKFDDIFGYAYSYNIPVYRANDTKIENYVKAYLYIREVDKTHANIIYEEQRKIPLVCINGTWYGTCGNGRCDPWEDSLICPEDCCTSDCIDNSTGEYSKYCVGYNGCKRPPYCEKNPLLRKCLNNETLLICTQYGNPSIVSCSEYGLEEGLLKALQYSVYSPLVLLQVEKFLKEANITTYCSVDHCEISSFDLDGDKNPLICHAFAGEMFYDPILKKTVCCGDDAGEIVVKESFIDLMGRIDVERRKVCAFASGYLSTNALPGYCLLAVRSDKGIEYKIFGEGAKIIINAVPIMSDGKRNDNCNISKIYEIFLNYYLDRKGDIRRILDEIDKCINYTNSTAIFYQSIEACKEGITQNCVLEMNVNYSPKYVEENYKQHYINYSVTIAGETYDFDKVDDLFFSITLLTPGEYVCKNGVFVLEKPYLNLPVGNISYALVNVPIKLTFGWRNWTSFINPNYEYTLAIQDLVLNYSQRDILKYERILQKGEGR